MKVGSLLLMSLVVLADVYLAHTTETKRPEMFYFAGAIMLFGALLTTAGVWG